MDGIKSKKCRSIFFFNFFWISVVVTYIDHLPELIMWHCHMNKEFYWMASPLRYDAEIMSFVYSEYQSWVDTPISNKLILSNGHRSRLSIEFFFISFSFIQNRQMSFSKLAAAVIVKIAAKPVKNAVNQTTVEALPFLSSFLFNFNQFFLHSLLLVVFLRWLIGFVRLLFSIICWIFIIIHPVIKCVIS